MYFFYQCQFLIIILIGALAKNGSFASLGCGSACAACKCAVCAGAKEFQNILSGSKKIKTRSVGLSCRQVSQQLLSELVVFICLSTGQNLLSSVWSKSVCFKLALSSIALPIIESRKGISPLRSHGTVRDSLPSHGSSC